jgi:hypothetical protein
VPRAFITLLALALSWSGHRSPTAGGRSHHPRCSAAPRPLAPPRATRASCAAGRAPYLRPAVAFLGISDQHQRTTPTPFGLVLTSSPSSTMLSPLRGSIMVMTASGGTRGQTRTNRGKSTHRIMFKPSSMSQKSCPATWRSYVSSRMMLAALASHPQSPSAHLPTARGVTMDKRFLTVLVEAPQIPDEVAAVAQHRQHLLCSHSRVRQPSNRAPTGFTSTETNRRRRTHCRSAAGSCQCPGRAHSWSSPPSSCAWSPLWCCGTNDVDSIPICNS